VEDRLVLRMNSPLSPQTLSQLNEGFADILIDGRIEQVPGPLAGEKGLYTDKPRLILPFDRRSTGRLRLLIDAVNAAP
jgi:hypothetical protein